MTVSTGKRLGRFFQVMSPMSGTPDFAADVQRSLEISGFEIRAQIMWRKSHFAIGRGDYHWQHEPCWYAVRKGGKRNWSGDRKQSTVWDITGLTSTKGAEIETRDAVSNGQKRTKTKDDGVVHN